MPTSSLKQDTNFEGLTDPEINALDLNALFRQVVSTAGGANQPLQDCLFNHMLSAPKTTLKLYSYAYILRSMYRAKLQISQRIFDKKKDQKEALSEDIMGFVSIYASSPAIQ